MDAHKLCHAGRDDVTTPVVRCWSDLFSDAGTRMRAVFAILTIVLLAACADGGLSPLPSDQVRVRFPAGGVVDVIEVDAVNRLPLRKAELVAPDGQATPASYLNVNPSPSITSYEELPNDPYAGLRVGYVASGRNRRSPPAAGDVASGDFQRLDPAPRPCRISAGLAKLSHPAQLRRCAAGRNARYSRPRTAAWRIIGLPPAPGPLCDTLVGVAPDLLHVLALDADQAGRAVAPRRMQITFVVEIGHAGLQRVVLDPARFAGLLFARARHRRVVGHDSLAACLTIDRP